MKKIKVGTAGFYRMRGLLFPTMTDDTPDDTELFVSRELAIKTIEKFFTLWNAKCSMENLEDKEIELLMEITTNIIIIFSSTTSQEAWLKNINPQLSNKSILDLIHSAKFEQACELTRKALI